MIAYNPEVDVEANVDAMTKAMHEVRSGQVTYAVRDSRIDEIEIKEGDIMGITDKKISVVGRDIAEVTQQLLDTMLEEGGEIVTVLYGSDAKEEDNESIKTYLEDKYPNIDVEIISGGQPLYYYLLAVE